ncbi:hypothetical protein ACET3Z_009311 [Daucus carota]
MTLLKFLPCYFFILIHLLISAVGINSDLSSKQNIPISKHDPRPKKLFVFGDSYADTGNIPRSQSPSWKQPYGVTFPGRPSGRFSDGRILTDYIAKFLGIQSPTPYQWRKLARQRLHNGMNFAYGGTGVFDTDVQLPNMTNQIDLLQKLMLPDSLYSKTDLQSSLVLVTLCGNDYSDLSTTGGSIPDIMAYITRVVNQLELNLKRIETLGARKIVVTGLQPLGCLPRETEESSYKQCNETENTLAVFHNFLLQQAVAKLNNESKSSKPVFTVLDLYASFNKVLQNKGGVMFRTPLKPCCMGIRGDSRCGSVNDKGVKLYNVCRNPESAFFWDTSHPTQAGWSVVFSSYLKATLEQCF